MLLFGICTAAPKSKIHSTFQAIHKYPPGLLSATQLPVADGPEFLEARCARDCLVLIRCKLYNNGEGRSWVVDDLVHGAIAAHLIDAPIQNDHLPIEIVEGANPEITIVQQVGAGDGPFVDPLYKSPRRRDLEERVQRYVEAMGE